MGWNASGRRTDDCREAEEEPSVGDEAGEGEGEVTRRMLTTGQAAKRLGCSPEYVMRLCNYGRLRCHRLPGSTHRRILEADLLEFMKRFGYPDFKNGG